MTITWWQLLVFVGSLSAIGMVFGIVCAWFVFKARTVTMPTPFLSAPGKKAEKTTSYVSDLYEEDVEPPMEEDLSPAAARLRSQKDVLGIVKGG
jgi:hypothetical protein